MSDPITLTVKWPDGSYTTLVGTISGIQSYAWALLDMCNKHEAKRIAEQLAKLPEKGKSAGSDAVTRPWSC